MEEGGAEAGHVNQKTSEGSAWEEMEGDGLTWDRRPVSLA